MKSISLYTAVLAAVMTFAFFAYTNPEVETKVVGAQANADVIQSTQLQSVRAVPTPSYAEFAGEALPLDNFDVRERLDRELVTNCYRHSGTIQYMKLANRFFPIIEPILAREGVPQDLKYLAVAESGLRNVKSPAGARGFWQFMKAAGTSHGLVINSEVDERYNLEKATVAACKYLKQSKARFGNWTMAAASYNMGSAGLNKNKNAQRANKFYDLSLNPETDRYIFRIVAIKEIMSNPEKYGFFMNQSDLYQPMPSYSIIQVNHAVANWGDFAKKYGTTYRMLKVYNPWLRSSSLTNSAKRTYKVKIPK